MIADTLELRSRLERHCIALTLIPVTLAVIWLMAAAPLIHFLEAQKAWRADVGIGLVRQSKLAAQRPAIEEALVTINASPIWGRFRDGEDESDVSSSIEQELRTLQSTLGINGRTFEILPTERFGSLVRYGVRITAATDNDRLNALLIGIRSSMYHFRVERFSIAAPGSRGSDGGWPLDVSMDVFGYVHANEES